MSDESKILTNLVTMYVTDEFSCFKDHGHKKHYQDKR